MDDSDPGLLPLGCLTPGGLLLAGKVALLVVFLYAVLSMLGLWGD